MTVPALRALGDACKTFEHNDVAGKLTAIQSLLANAKAQFNAHTHSGSGVTSNMTISAAAIGTMQNPFEMQVCCEAMKEVAGFFNGVQLLVDDVRTKYNAHWHGVATSTAHNSGSLTYAALNVPADYNIERINRACPALGQTSGGAGLSGMGRYFYTIVTLANDLRAKFVVHAHASGVLTNTTNNTVSASGLTGL